MTDRTLAINPKSNLQNPETSILDIPVLADDTTPWLNWIEASQDWLEAKRRRSGRNNTVKTYSTAWKQFFKWAAVKPWQVTPDLATRWAAWLAYQGHSPATINLKITALASFYDHVQARYDLWPPDKRNPFHVIERHKVTPYGRAQFPTLEETQALLAAINTRSITGKRNKALFLTLLVTCRRATEILNLQFQHLTPTRKGDHKGDYIFTYTTKGGATKKALLPQICYHLIQSYLQAADRWPLLPDPEGYLFTTLYPDRATRLPHIHHPTLDQPLTTAACNKILKKYARRAGLDPAKAHLHALRHAGARLRVQQMRAGQGLDLDELRHLLGHTNLSTTQIYTTTLLDDPVDPGAHAALIELLPERRNLPKGKTTHLTH